MRVISFLQERRRLVEYGLISYFHPRKKVNQLRFGIEYHKLLAIDLSKFHLPNLSKFNLSFKACKSQT